jgi:Protein of unknown function (DUF2478)
MLPAAEAVRQDIARGCDLVLLSKFGKLEAGNSGLVDALTAAMEAHVPVLTSVSPAFEAAWAKFAAPLFVTLPADAVEIDAWWQAVRSPVRTMDSAAVSVVSYENRNRLM